jgi:hypothetical protein
MNWILEADIVSFFDSVGRTALLEMLLSRIADESLLRLVGKCLHVGVLDGAEYSEPEVGTAQGSVPSPLLGNVYLHHVLDSWFEREDDTRRVITVLDGALRADLHPDNVYVHQTPEALHERHCPGQRRADTALASDERCHAPIARTTTPPVQLVHIGSRARTSRSRLGTVNTHCRYGAYGSTRSPDAPRCPLCGAPCSAYRLGTPVSCRHCRRALGCFGLR